MVSPEALERVLRDFNFTYGTEIAAVLTKTGAPIAIQANVPVEGEHFATMAATLLGSMDVMYRGAALEVPRTVLARTNTGLLLILRVEPDAFFLAMAGPESELAEKHEEALESLQRVLDPLRPLVKFAY